MRLLATSVEGMKVERQGLIEQVREQWPDDELWNRKAVIALINKRDQD
jgi:hypothetical protein